MLWAFLDILSSCTVTVGYLPYKIPQLLSIYMGQRFHNYLVIYFCITHVVHYVSFNKE